MQTVDIRANLINSINALPADILTEVSRFLEFLEYKHGELTKDEVLKNLETSVAEVQMIKEGKLKAMSARELLDEL